MRMLRFYCRRTPETISDKVGKQNNRVSGGSAPIHSALLGGANHLSDGLIRAQDFDIKPSARRHSTGISHSVPFTGTRHHLDVWPALALGTSLTCLCHIMPRPCISARSPADYCANYGAQLFHPVEVSISQARSPNAVPRRHASPGTRKHSFLGTNVCCPWVGQTPPIILAIRALSDTF